MEAPIIQKRTAELTIKNRFMVFTFPRIPNPTIALLPVLQPAP
jgi:hypothetical protein